MCASNMSKLCNSCHSFTCLFVSNENLPQNPLRRLWSQSWGLWAALWRDQSILFKKEPVKRDEERIWKDSYPRSSQSSVCWDHACIIAIEYLMPRIRSTVRSQESQARTLNSSSWVLQETCEKFLWNGNSRDYALAKEDVCGMFRVYTWSKLQWTHSR